MRRKYRIHHRFELTASRNRRGTLLADDPARVVANRRSAAPIRSPHVPNGMRDLPEAEARAKPPFEHPPGRIGCFCLTSFQSEPRGRARFPPQRRAVAKRVPTPDERAMGSTAAGNTAPRYAIGSQLPPHVEISRDRGSRGGVGG